MTINKTKTKYLLMKLKELKFVLKNFKSNQKKYIKEQVKARTSAKKKTFAKEITKAKNANKTISGLKKEIEDYNNKLQQFKEKPENILIKEHNEILFNLIAEFLGDTFLLADEKALKFARKLAGTFGFESTGDVIELLLPLKENLNFYTYPNKKVQDVYHNKFRIAANNLISASLKGILPTNFSDFENNPKYSNYTIAQIREIIESNKILNEKNKIKTPTFSQAYNQVVRDYYRKQFALALEADFFDGLFDTLVLPKFEEVDFCLEVKKISHLHLATQKVVDIFSVYK